MGKPTICIGENKGADQLRSNCEADQRLCFRYMDSKIPLQIQNFQPLTIFCDCTARFVSDLFGTQIVSFITHMLICKSRFHSLADPVNTTDPTNTTLCECECWLYNMLYGTSGWNNLTYAEKEEALSEITNEVFHTNKPIKVEFSNNERNFYSILMSAGSTSCIHGILGWNNLAYVEKEEALSEITNEVFHTNKPIKWTFSNNDRHLYSISLQYFVWDLGLEQPRICGEVRGFIGDN